MSTTDYILFNPAAEVTSPNFRGWMRRKIEGLDKSPYSATNQAAGVLFLDKKYLGSIGRKNVTKILDKLLLANKGWLSGIQVVVPDNPLTNEQIHAFMNDLCLDDLDDDDDELSIPTSFLGYKTERPTDQSPLDMHDPDCMIVQAGLDIEVEGTSVKQGDWVVALAEDDGKTTYACFSTMDEAFEHAKQAYGILRFQSAPEAF